MRASEKLALILAVPCIAEVIACATLFVKPAIGFSDAATTPLIAILVTSGFAALVGLVVVCSNKKSRILWICLVIFAAAFLAIALEIVLGAGAVANSLA
jgi:hypothetical protein